MEGSVSPLVSVVQPRSALPGLQQAADNVRVAIPHGRKEIECRHPRTPLAQLIFITKYSCARAASCGCGQLSKPRPSREAQLLTYRRTAAMQLQFSELYHTSARINPEM